MISLMFVPHDTMQAIIYVDKKPRGSAAANWTLAYTDSVIIKVDGGGYKEVVVRKPGTDQIGGVDYELRIRVAQKSTGTGGGTGYYDLTVPWKP